MKSTNYALCFLLASCSMANAQTALTYTLSQNPNFVLRSDGLNVSLIDHNGVAYQTYLAWLLAGNTPSPAPAPAPVMPMTVAVTSTATPTLSATYNSDANTIAALVNIVSAISSGLGLPGGGSTFNYNDSSNIAHTFTSAQITSLTSAIRNYDYAYQQYINGSGPQPVSPITIP